MAENMVCELWENQPEAALLLDTPEGQLHTRLVGWLNIAPMFAGKVTTRTPAQFIDYAQQLDYDKRYGVTDKIFVKGREKYDGKL